MSVHALVREYKVEVLSVLGMLVYSLLFFLFFYSLEAQAPSVIVHAGTFTVDQKTEEYLKTNPSFSELSNYLTTLAEKKGAVYALNVLIHGALPPNIDSHLMGHNIARKLYEQRGVGGLAYCTSDLGYACAHAIVIDALFERGMVVFDEINDICARVEGQGAYAMCFHGFGHGVLAFANYELPQAIELCGKVGTEAYGNYESVECVGGAIMEMRGGIHDPGLWELNGKKYLDEDHPLDMCLADYMDEKYRYICFVYITPFIFDSIGAADIPTFEQYGPAIRICNELAEPKYREACFGGFAKEFVGFLFGRDIRQIEDITDAQLSEVVAACELSEVEDGIAACVKHAVIDLLSSGEKGIEITGRFCTLVDAQFSDYCVTSYIEIVQEQYALGAAKAAAFCDYIGKTFGRSCPFNDGTYGQ